LWSSLASISISNYISFYIISNLHQDTQCGKT
jgi:hypothetical protein